MPLLHSKRKDYLLCVRDSLIYRELEDDCVDSETDVCL